MSDTNLRARLTLAGGTDSMALTVLVTGSSGFIGFHVVHRLHATGHIITALD